MWWQWLIFGLLAFIIPVNCFYLYFLATKKVKQTKEQKAKSSTRLLGIILYYWLVDCFYMVSFNEWLVWQFILGIAILLIFFSNLAISVSYPSKKSIFVIFSNLLDFVVGIGVSVYLIYIVPNQDLKDILIPVVSAVYGGLITLVGVGWTIRWTNKENADSRKNEIKPFILPTPYFEGSSQDKKAHTVIFSNGKEGTNAYFMNLENDEKVPFVCVSVKFQNQEFPCVEDAFVARGELFSISISGIDGEVTENRFILNVKDVDSNLLTYEVEAQGNQITNIMEIPS